MIIGEMLHARIYQLSLSLSWAQLLKASLALRAH